MSKVVKEYEGKQSSEGEGCGDRETRLVDSISFSVNAWTDLNYLFNLAIIFQELIICQAPCWMLGL